MRPVDLPIQETLRFVSEHITSVPSRVLEVGCANGELALGLKSLGHDLVAVDSSDEAIQQARHLGVDARWAKWPEFEEELFDVILFTRSLHHIRPLLKAVEQAHRLLRPRGLVIVEDFAYEEARQSTVDWFYGIVSLLDACGQLSLEGDGLAKALLTSKGNLRTWQDRHDRDLNTASSIAFALKERFEQLAEASVPYVYRYLCPLLESGDRGYAIALRVFEMEERLGKLGAVNLIGRRFVGRRRSANRTTADS